MPFVFRLIKPTRFKQNKKKQGSFVRRKQLSIRVVRLRNRPRDTSPRKLPLRSSLEILLSSHNPRKSFLIDGSNFCLALVVRFITRRYIGEYDPNLEKVYTFHTVMDNEMVYFEILDTAGQPHVSKSTFHFIFYRHECISTFFFFCRKPSAWLLNRTSDGPKHLFFYIPLLINVPSTNATDWNF